MSETAQNDVSVIERLITLARRMRKIRRPGEAADLLDLAASLAEDGEELRREAESLRLEDGLEDFDSVHSRHTNVRDDNFGRVFTASLQAGGAGQGSNRSTSRSPFSTPRDRAVPALSSST